jgi:hypothetical protein
VDSDGGEMLYRIFYLFDQGILLSAPREYLQEIILVTVFEVSKVLFSRNTTFKIIIHHFNIKS